MGILILIGFVVVLGLLMIVSTWAINYAAQRMVGDKHHALEEIVTTGQAPASWRLPYERRIARLSDDPNRVEKVARLERQAAEKYAREADRLLKYVQTTNLVDSEETRASVIGKLTAARATWLTHARQIPR